jgi:hypothetical protein
MQPSRFDPTTISNVQIFASGGRAIHGIATATEQRGSTAGRIWAAVAVDSGASGDRVYLYRSDNGGTIWSSYAIGTLSGSDQINFDQLDMEVVEADTGQKFIWVYYGYRGNNGSGNWSVGGMVIQSPTFGGSLFALGWPGASSTQRFYRPRLTSDNAYYTTNAWLYIVCSFDSVTATGHFNAQRYARCINPYTVSPTFSYLTEKFFWNTATTGSTLYDLHTDIAFFRNSSDSIITSYSNVPDSTRIFFAKAPIGGSAGNIDASGGGVGGSEPSDYKRYARLSSNGSNNGSVFCVFNQFTSGYWNVKYFRTTNFGNFGTIAGQSVLWGNAGRTNYQPDIVGVRNGDIHYFAFTTITSAADSLHFVSATVNGSTSHTARMNGLAITSGTQGAKPGFRYVSGDSCFLLYSASGPVDVWAASGCTGPLTDVQNDQVPGTFALSQNYPNPFNPSSRIEYSIPRSGDVRIAVYDVLGREVQVLINGYHTAGVFSTEMSASRLASGVYFYRMELASDGGLQRSDVKKMVVLK